MRNYIIIFLLLFSTRSLAKEYPEFELKLKNGKWIPNTFEVPAGKRFKLKIQNLDPLSEEFESDTLVVEKFLGPRRKISIILGPLKVGEYAFYAELNPNPDSGKIIAVDTDKKEDLK